MQTQNPPMYFVKTLNFGRPLSRGELGISWGSSQNTTSCWDVSWTSFWTLSRDSKFVDAVEPPDNVDVGEELDADPDSDPEPAMWSSRRRRFCSSKYRW